MASHVLLFAAVRTVCAFLFCTTVYLTSREENCFHCCSRRERTVRCEQWVSTDDDGALRNSYLSTCPSSLYPTMLDIQCFTRVIVLSLWIQLAELRFKKTKTNNKTIGFVIVVFFFCEFIFKMHSDQIEMNDYYWFSSWKKAVKETNIINTWAFFIFSVLPLQVCTFGWKPAPSGQNWTHKPGKHHQLVSKTCDIAKKKKKYSPAQ